MFVNDLGFVIALCCAAPLALLALVLAPLLFGRAASPAETQPVNYDHWQE